MPRILLHRHQSHESGVVFASFKWHAIWWTVEAESEQTDASASGARLPPFHLGFTFK